MKISRRRFVWNASALAGGLLLVGSSFYKKGGTLRFGMVTDSHYADREVSGTRYYRESMRKMKEFVSTMNHEAVDFVVHLGDFKDEDPKKHSEDTLHYLKRIESEYAQFQGPRYHCVGNHDVDSITKSQFLSQIENTGINPKSSYYSFDLGGVHFVVLDANYHADGRDHFYAEGANWQDTNIPQSQLRWLETDLNRGTLPIIVFCHHPLYEYYSGDHKYHVNNYQEVQQLMETSGKVMAVFHGHVHREGHQQINGIHYFTQLGMVDYSGLENNSFSIVEISKRQMEIIGFKRVSSQNYSLKS
ncbi:metallophosphoesterase family protein [Reichenbachiella agariperforans]|uniref:metallophosphoesterase family protein n=1 Tax=Reichenbachiella agariperforans TaxID=156994 RepID=UPI001C088FE1|nr:metallophosphoesterase [Reichenbachiella agariperforans]MBU2915724.1 metallophosphoesterase [Reichenbachiella agariperforans]